MNQTLRKFYLIISFIASSLYIYKTDFTFSDKKEKPLYIKYFFIWISTLLLIYSLYYTNSIVNNLLMPLLLFLNVGILIIISLNNDNFSNKFHIIPIIGVIYLLVTYRINKFKTNKGILINIDDQWIYHYIIILILWFITSSYLPKVSKIICILLIIYPLLFPLEEYFIHRLFSLIGVYLILNFPNIKKI